MPRWNPANEHDAETGRNILREVGDAAVFYRVVSTQLQFLGERIGRMSHLVGWLAEGTPGGVEEGDAKDNADGRGGNAGCEVGTSHGTYGSSHLEKHSDPHIGKTLPDIGD